MELRHLRYFVAVAEEHNIHRAAKRLNISQPPLSLTIKQLEEELGIDLFTREGRGIQITRAGASFLDHAREILHAADKAKSQARSVGQGVSGTLKIGFVSSTITGILQDSVTAYKKNYPSVMIELEQSTNQKIPELLLKRQIDLGILRIPEIFPSGIDSQEASRESWYLAIPQKHPLLSIRRKMTVKDLRDIPLIFYPRSNTHRGFDDVMDLFKKSKITPTIVQQATEQMTILALVAAGGGIGIVPECMSKIKIPNVVYRPLDGTQGRTGFSFVFRDEEDPLIKRFLECVRQKRG